MTSASGPSALWYLTRGTGAVTLVLLTVSIALGIANIRRFQTERVPRFVVDAIHRSVSLLAVVFLTVHVMTSVLDTFAPIRLVDVFIPFVSAYRPLWLGLGAVACDLLIAVTVTSVLRRRLGYGAWRATHWLAYACWPVALVHGFGTGSDAKTTWMLALTGGCVLVVLVAVWARISTGWPEHIGARSSAVVASIAAPIALIAWLPGGPLGSGWARRAGTPSSLLPRASTQLVSTATRNAAAGTTTATGASAATGQTTATGSAGLGVAPVTGSLRQSQLPDGLVHLDLRLTRTGQSVSAIDIRIQGRPLSGGGVQMTSSVVTLGTTANPALYRGTVTGLAGTTIDAHVQGSRAALSLTAQLRIDPGTGTVAGTVRTAAAGMTSAGDHAEGDGSH